MRELKQKLLLFLGEIAICIEVVVVSFNGIVTGIVALVSIIVVVGCC